VEPRTRRPARRGCRRPSFASKDHDLTTRAPPSHPGRQAPPRVWTPEELFLALTQGTIEEKVALLRTAGILDERGKLAKKYRSWGNKPSRTPEVEDYR
jgi:hypothetical protein